MQFLKKHYEKVLLSIVLLGLAAAAAVLPLLVAQVRDRLDEIRGNLTVKVKPKPFKPQDEWVTTNKTLAARLDGPMDLDFAGAHNLFNPVLWKRRPDGQVIPIRTGAEIGPGAVAIVQIKELHLTATFDGVVQGGNPGDPPKYTVTVKRDTDPNQRGDSRTVSMAMPHLNLFDLINVQGPTNDPTALVIKLKDEVEPITVTKENPYVHVVGYSADLAYSSAPSKKQSWNNQKVNATIKLEDDPETYKIVAITRNEVVLSADSNKRRWIIKRNPVSTTASAK